LDNAKINQLESVCQYLKTQDLYLRQSNKTMSKSKERKIPSKISMILAGIVLVAVVFQFTRERFKREAVVSSVKKGSIRDSVSGNLKVLPSL
jgi:hypothetical protein